jgi:Ca2+-binding RTX toxin-like protein
VFEAIRVEGVGPRNIPLTTSSILFALAVRNEGTLRATGVRLELSLDVDVGFEIRRATGASCSPFRSAVRCRIDDLGPGREATLELLARPSVAAPLRGTAAGEEICARAGDDVVEALAGADRVDGGWGRDTVRGGAGRDRLIGGRGDDTILARDGERDTIECGWGIDTAVVDRADRVLRGCEHVTRR